MVFDDSVVIATRRPNDTDRLQMEVPALWGVPDETGDGRVISRGREPSTNSYPIDKRRAPRSQGRLSGGHRSRSARSVRLPPEARSTSDICPPLKHKNSTDRGSVTSVPRWETSRFGYSGFALLLVVVPAGGDLGRAARRDVPPETHGPCHQPGSCGHRSFEGTSLRLSGQRVPISCRLSPGPTCGHSRPVHASESTRDRLPA